MSLLCLLMILSDSNNCAEPGAKLRHVMCSLTLIHLTCSFWLSNTFFSAQTLTQTQNRPMRANAAAPTAVSPGVFPSPPANPTRLLLPELHLGSSREEARLAIGKLPSVVLAQYLLNCGREGAAMAAILCQRIANRPDRANAPGDQAVGSSAPP